MAAECMPWLHRQHVADPILEAVVQNGITLEQYDNMYDRFQSRRESNEFLVKILQRIMGAIGIKMDVCMMTLTRHVLEHLKENPYASWPDMQDVTSPQDGWLHAFQDYCDARRKKTMNGLLVHLQNYVRKQNKE